MNDELITRLRAGREPIWGTPTDFDALLLAAADALEAAQAQLAIARETADLAARALVERDAEAALADQLAEALFVMHQGFAPLVVSGVDTGAASDAYRAHRERRTTPTKDGDQ